MMAMLSRLAAAAAASACLSTAAQVPAPRYDSAFAGYKAYAEPQVASWKETNEKIGNTTGHAGHAMTTPKEAPKPAPAPVSKTAVPVKAKAKADPHAGHNH